MTSPSTKRISESDMKDLTPNYFDSLETLTRSRLEPVFQKAITAIEANKSPATQNTTTVNDIGEFLVSAADVWVQLTKELVQSPEMHQAILDAHEDSKSETRLADLSGILLMDIDLARLCKIRDLTERFSRDIHDIWHAGVKGSPTSSR
ncbi:hypothetical protein AUP68_17801 [Ilyonectria robusta]